MKKIMNSAILITQELPFSENENVQKILTRKIEIVTKQLNKICCSCFFDDSWKNLKLNNELKSLIIDYTYNSERTYKILKIDKELFSNESKINLYSKDQEISIFNYDWEWIISFRKEFDNIFDYLYFLKNKIKICQSILVVDRYLTKYYAYILSKALNIHPESKFITNPGRFQETLDVINSYNKNISILLIPTFGNLRDDNSKVLLEIKNRLLNGEIYYNIKSRLAELGMKEIIETNILLPEYLGDTMNNHSRYVFFSDKHGYEISSSLNSPRPFSAVPINLKDIVILKNNQEDIKEKFEKLEIIDGILKKYRDKKILQLTKNGELRLLSLKEAKEKVRVFDINQTTNE